MGCRWTLGTIGVGMVLSGLTPADGRAQTRMSERATLSQMVSGAVIGLDYGRPQARGRIPFGERGQAVVRWGEVWTPGANWATTLELSRDATIEGTPVRKGKYSMWVAPAPGPWTVYFHANPKLYHDQHPKPDSMAYAFPVTPVEGAAVEMLTFDFPRVTRTGAVLRLQWGTKSLNLAIEVGAPVMTRTISAGQAAPYLGRYDLSFVGDRAEPAERVTAEIVLRDGHLLMVMSGFESELVPTKVPDEFLMGFLDQGVIVDIDPEFPLRFRMAGGRAVGITAKTNDGSEWIKGNRLP